MATANREVLIRPVHFHERLGGDDEVLALEMNAHNTSKHMGGGTAGSTNKNKDNGCTAELTAKRVRS